MEELGPCLREREQVLVVHDEPRGREAHREIAQLVETWSEERCEESGKRDTLARLIEADSPNVKRTQRGARHRACSSPHHVLNRDYLEMDDVEM